MDIRQLRYFCTIVEAKQITKAAKVLHIAQPPLSHQLKLLEEELGAQLIVRDAKKWEVTKAGRRLYERAKYVLNLLEDTQTEIAEIEKGVSGTLAVGTSMICISSLTEPLKQFHHKFPNVYVNLLHGDTYYLEEMLQQNEIDVALLLLPVESDNYHILNLQEDPFVVVIPRQWEGKFPSYEVTLEEVAKQNLLLGRRTSGQGVYENILEQFKQANLHPHVILDCPDISSILTLVSMEMGITIMPMSAVHQVFEKKFKVLKFSGASFHTKPAVVWRKDRYFPKATSELIALFYKE